MPLNNLKGKMTRSFTISGLAILSLAGCAAGPESVTTEHKGKVTLVHHRRRTLKGLVDKIEAISAKGVVTRPRFTFTMSAGSRMVTTAWMRRTVTIESYNPSGQT
jgi:hypothetical protein